MTVGPHMVDLRPTYGWQKAHMRITLGLHEDEYVGPHDYDCVGPHADNSRPTC